MAEFEPWLGNRNATDQQKNEYIRKLKAALTESVGLKFLGGTYTGDGSANRVITVADTSMNVKYIQLASTIGTGYNVQTFEGLNPVSLVYTTGAAPSNDSNAITALGIGSFTVNSATYTNAVGEVYVYFAVGV